VHRSNRLPILDSPGHWLRGLALAAGMGLIAASAEDISSPNRAGQVPSGAPVIAIDFFYEPGCAECHRVTSEVIPKLQQQYRGHFVLNEWDTNVRTNYERLAQFVDRLAIREDFRVLMVLNGNRPLVGADQIASRLFPVLDEMISTGAGVVQPVTPAPPAATGGHDYLAQRMKGFTLAAVLVGGLTDGINPCSISTLVFLISVLSLSKIGGRNILWVGCSYCLATFITYTAIGYGLLETVHQLTGFPVARIVLDTVLIGLLFVLAFLSFRDAIRFRATGSAKEVTLQMPDRVKRVVHRVMRAGFSTRRSQVMAAFGIGCVVTGLEVVCTGQSYLPTLRFVLKSGNDQVTAQAIGYLLVYNLMFLVPLVTVFILTYRGLKLRRLIDWSVTNVFFSKMLLGSFFLVLGVAILLLKRELLGELARAVSRLWSR
jgi:hypothetical protein